MPMNERVWQLLASRAGRLLLWTAQPIRAGGQAADPREQRRAGRNSPAMPEFEGGQDGRPR